MMIKIYLDTNCTWTVEAPCFMAYGLASLVAAVDYALDIDPEAETLIELPH